jgi:FMN-dependent NADH-azoreductase
MTMSTVLVLTTSALGEASVSSLLVQDAVAHLKARDPELKVVARDLGATPIPHLTTDAATAIRGGTPANAAQKAAQALSDQLIAELNAADPIIIGAPMYNFGIASTLKSWFDYVLRAGVTFRYGETGPVGLVTGKRAVVIESRGGLYTEGPAKAFDAQEPHLRAMLGLMGIADVTFVHAEKLAFGPDARTQAIDTARTKLGETLHKDYLRAA